MRTASPSRTPISSGSTRCTTGSSAARRSPTAVRRPRSRLRPRPRRPPPRPRARPQALRRRRSPVAPRPWRAVGRRPAAGAATTTAAAATPAPAAAAPTAAATALRSEPAGRDAVRRTAARSAAPAPGLEIIFRPDPTVWDGRFANNGWLQELPKPLTKITWDTSAWMQPALAEQHSLRDGDVIELRYSGNTARMPIFRVAGHPRESVTVFFGYGRRMAGRVGNAVRDRRRLQRVPAAHVGCAVVRHRPRDREDRRALPAGDHAGTPPDGRARAGPRGRARGVPARAEGHRRDGREAATDADPVPEHEYTGYKWGMAIDLTSCTGCGACTIACVAENNIPVVGKEQVAARPRDALDPRRSLLHRRSRARRHGAVGAPAGAVHAVRERALRAGLPGRRDDAQHGRPERHGLQPLRRHALLLEQLPVQGPPLQLPALSGLGHPEPASRCATRTSRSAAAASWRSAPTACSASTRRGSTRSATTATIRDGEIVTACQAVCPADAIVFGDLNDPNSQVAKLKAQERNYGVLEDLNTRPRTTYLAALRNPNPELEPAGARRTEH